MYSVLVVCLVESVLLLWLSAELFLRYRQQQRYLDKHIEALRDISAALRAIADGRSSYEGNRPSQSVTGKDSPQLKVAELPPEAIAPSLKRPPKPPSGSGAGVSRTD